MLTLLTHTFHFQSDVLFGIKQQKPLQNSIQSHRTQAPTCTPTTTALRCNLDVLMEKTSTLFNYILSLPIFAISNFRCVLNVVCFLLGNSPASEFRHWLNLLDESIKLPML